MKSSYFLKLFLIILLALPVGYLFSSGNNFYKARSFNSEKIEEFRNSKDFKYAQPPKFDPLKQGILTRLAHWLGSFLSRVPLGFWKIIPYALMLAAVILIIFYIRKVTLSGVVSGSNVQVRKGLISEENIHAMDFDRMIDAAIADRQLRLAVRLYFLKTLKFLDDRKLIAHSREKTNREYLIELNNSSVKEDFKWMARSFEFVWYGNVNPEQQRFEEIRQRYDNFFHQMGRQNSR